MIQLLFYFNSGKKGGDYLFDKLDKSKWNAYLQELMPGLTAEVFRTCYASITSDDMVTFSILVFPIKVASFLYPRQVFNLQ